MALGSGFGVKEGRKGMGRQLVWRGDAGSEAKRGADDVGHAWRVE